MKILISLCLLASIFMFIGCDDADVDQSEKQAVSLKEANAQIGMPAIHNFQERKLLKMILELRDQENLVCYCYIVASQTGELKFLGKCIGFGISYSTQYTSPIKPWGTAEGHSGDPQADPNGLFMPASSEGTWIMLIGPDNKPHPVYVEPRIIVSPFALK